jgi:hypothetical protein
MSGMANVKKEDSDPPPPAAPDHHYNDDPRVDVVAEPTPKRQRTHVSHLSALHELLEERKWDEAIIMVESLRMLNGTARIPELDVHFGDSVPTPLVYALLVYAPDQLIMILVDEYTATQQYKGQWLLHMACSSPTLSWGTIKTILNLYPEAILKTTEDEEKVNAFDIILQKKPPLAVFDTMVKVWADQKGIGEHERWTTFLRIPGTDGMLPLHAAIQHHAPTDLILKMIETYPDNVTKGIESNGYPALHIAAFNGCSLEVLMSLLEHAPGIIGSQRGDDKDTPLHLLLDPSGKERWVKNEKGMIPPHEMVRHLIHAHAYLLENLKGKHQKGEQYYPGKRAQTLVCKTKNEQKQTVLDCAKILKKELFPASSSELRTLLEELEQFERKDFYPPKWKMEAP